MEALRQFLREHAEGDLLPWRSQVAAAEHCGATLAQAEAASLAIGLLPARYQRNRKTISVEQQLALFQSRVAVIGCGGLGGYVIEELARLGVGTIVAIDHDHFEEHNLNRQLLSSPALLKCSKADAASRRVAEINPAVTLVAVQERFAADEGERLFRGCQVVVDAVDSIATRLELRDACACLGLPLVHGAIAGWYGQLTTEFPGDGTLQLLYACATAGKGAEQHLGNPAFTPAVVASLEVAEVCKVLLGVGEPLRHRVLNVNLLDMSFDEIPFA